MPVLSFPTILLVQELTASASSDRTLNPFQRATCDLPLRRDYGPLRQVLGATPMCFRNKREK